MEVNWQVDLRDRRPPREPGFKELARYQVEEKIIAEACELRDTVSLEATRFERLDGGPLDKDPRPLIVRKEQGNAPTTEGETKSRLLDLVSMGTIGASLAGAAGIAAFGLTGGIAGIVLGGLSTVLALDRSGNGDSSSGTFSREGDVKVAEIHHPRNHTTYRLLEEGGAGEYSKNLQAVTFDSDQQLRVNGLEVANGDFTHLPEPNMNEYKLVGLAPLQESDERADSVEAYHRKRGEDEVRQRFFEVKEEIGRFGKLLLEQNQSDSASKVAVYNGVANGGLSGEMILDGDRNLVSLHGTSSVLGRYGDVLHELRKYDQTETDGVRYFVGDRLFLVKDDLLTEFERPAAKPRDVTFYLQGIPIYSKPEPRLSGPAEPVTSSVT